MRRKPIRSAVAGMFVLAVASLVAYATMPDESGGGTDTDDVQVTTERQFQSGGPPNNPWSTLLQLNLAEDPNGTCGEGYASGTGYKGTPQWVNHTIDLTGYEDRYVKIRFAFDTGDALYNNHAGSWVKNVQLDGEYIENWVVLCCSG
ncbi:MAG: hypothetical protein ACLFWL_13175 [Candidatus Brocadiia bacterium]